jgi:hypothetical protein
MVENARATRAERQSMAARKSPPDVYANVGKQNKEGRHVGLDFYDLLIEALKIPVTGERILKIWAKIVCAQLKIFDPTRSSRLLRSPPGRARLVKS